MYCQNGLALHCHLFYSALAGSTKVWTLNDGTAEALLASVAAFLTDFVVLNLLLVIH